MTIRYENGVFRDLPEDKISPEGPLAIKLRTSKESNISSTDLVVTMRSPGQDTALALGYLFAEGIIHRLEDVTKIQQNSTAGQIALHLSPAIDFNSQDHQRRGPASASCGVCGKQHLDQLEHTNCYFPQQNIPQVAPSVICQLPRILRKKQALFSQTGGMHAAARFSTEGKLLDVQEDVGRHNALDKLLGYALQDDALPWRNQVILVSGRVSYELVQKAAMAGTPILAAIGAPSSLAIELAEANGMTLIGFVKDDRFNVYCYGERLKKQ